MNDKQDFTKGSIPVKMRWCCRPCTARWTCFLLVFAKPVAVLMQAPEEALDLTVQYIRICGAGMVFVIAYSLPMSYFMSIRPGATLTEIGLAAPAATVFGILLCTAYYIKMNRKLERQAA